MAGVIEPSSWRVVVFDLDEALLDRREAWLFAVEEAFAATAGTRINARPLAEAYRLRPFRDVFGVLTPDADAQERCERLAATMYRRSALKRLLVHDGIGMALDALREARIEIGAITAEAHGDAVKQMQSTGLDRFVTVLSATPPQEGWDVIARWNDCLRFLEQDPDRAVFVSPSEVDRHTLAATGAMTIAAGWNGEPGAPGVRHARELTALLRAGAPRKS